MSQAYKCPQSWRLGPATVFKYSSFLTRLPCSVMLLSVTEHAAARGVQQCLEMYYLWNQYELCSPVPCCFRSWKCRSELHLDQCFLCLAQRQLGAHSPGDCPQRSMDTEPLDSVPESPRWQCLASLGPAPTWRQMGTGAFCHLEVSPWEKGCDTAGCGTSPSPCLDKGSSGFSLWPCVCSFAQKANPCARCYHSWQEEGTPLTLQLPRSSAV